MVVKLSKFTNMPPADLKEIYANLALKESFPFQGQPWWLDAVCGPEGWGAAIAFDDEGNPIGALPFGKMVRQGVRMPLFSSYHNIWLQDMNAGRNVSQYHWEHRIINDLTAQIPKSWIVDQQYSPSFSNGLPFANAGFRLQVRYTYQQDANQAIDWLWQNMESATRNLIRKAKKMVRISTEATPAELFAMIELSYARKGKRCPFQIQDLLAIDAVLVARNMRTIYKAADEEGNIHAACYVVWDKVMAHGLLSGLHPDFRQSGALYRIYWHAIKDAVKRNIGFDFEGSMHPPVERVFRSFGARRVPYLRVVRYRNRLFEAMAVLLGKNH